MPPKKFFHHLREVTVEAIQLTPETVHEAAEWTGGVEAVTFDPFDASKKFVALNIPTRDEVTRASQDDYIIRDADGYFSVKGRRAFEIEHDELED